MKDIQKQRVSFSVAIIASVFAFMAVANNQVFIPLKVVAGISASCLFIYIILSAAFLQSNRFSLLSTFNENPKNKERAYNWGVEIYGLALIGGCFTLIFYQDWTKDFINSVFNENTAFGWVAILVGILIESVILLYARTLSKK